jgi:hypothetical protein
MLPHSLNNLFSNKYLFDYNDMVLLALLRVCSNNLITHQGMLFSSSVPYHEDLLSLQPANIESKKKALRTRIRETVYEKDTATYLHFTQSSLHKEALSIGFYKSIQWEADTEELMRKSLQDGKNVYIPSWTKTSMKFNIQPVMTLDRKSLESMAIQEEPSMQVVLVPGMAFDRHGN